MRNTMKYTSCLITFLLLNDNCLHPVYVMWRGGFCPLNFDSKLFVYQSMDGKINSVRVALAAA